ALRDIFGRVAHVIAVKGVPQPVLDHRVDHLRVTHFDTVAQVHAVRRLAHALLAAGDDDLAVAVADRLVAERDRAQPRTAQLVDPVRRHLIGDAGRHRGLARRVLALAGGEDLAENDFRPLGGFDPGP